MNIQKKSLYGCKSQKRHRTELTGLTEKRSQQKRSLRIEQIRHLKIRHQTFLLSFILLKNRTGYMPAKTKRVIEHTIYRLINGFTQNDI